MRLLGFLIALSAALPCAAQPEVIAVAPGDGGEMSLYQVRIDGLDHVQEGSVLAAYRRLPAERGDALFRGQPVWLESGRLRIVALGPNWATAQPIAGPPRSPLPSFDDDGLPLDRVCIGDRVLETGEIAFGDQAVVGRFDLSLLFGVHGDQLSEGGAETLALWLSRFEDLGPVRIDVSVPGPHRPVTGHRPEIQERLHPVPLKGDEGYAVLQRFEDERAVALRRAAAIARAVEAALGWAEGRVFASVSWTDDHVSEEHTATIRLLSADVVPSMRPVGGSSGGSEGAAVEQGVAP